MQRTDCHRFAQGSRCSQQPCGSLAFALRRDRSGVRIERDDNEVRRAERLPIPQALGEQRARVSRPALV